LIVQDANMIDRQVQEAHIEYSSKCMRMDKVKIPLVGGIMRDVAAIFGAKGGFLPRFHLVAARLGSGATQVVAERWQYRGDWLHAVYDTRQVFRNDYPHGVHSVLHPAYFAPDLAKGTGLRWALLRYFGAKQTAFVPPMLKPKSKWIERVQRLPEHRRIPAMRTLGLID